MSITRRQIFCSHGNLKQPTSLARLVLSANNGFTIIEAVMAGVILIVVSLMFTVATRTIITAITSTDSQSRLNALIDNDISAMRSLSNQYNACSTSGASGSTSTSGCLSGTTETNSYWYFPDPASSANVTAFDTACQSTTSAAHITNNFITAISALTVSGVTKTVAR